MIRKLLLPTRLLAMVAALVDVALVNDPLQGAMWAIIACAWAFQIGLSFREKE